MVVGDNPTTNIKNIMSGIENTGSVKQHNHKKKLKQRFDIIRKLGQGTFGKVQLGINKETGQEVAIKTIKKSKIESEADLIRIRREIQIMSSVQHPNIIHIYEVFENREKMVLVMEYAAGGELYDYLSERKVLSEDEARRIFRQIATASYYCHKHKICHRDLKLENILLDENNNAKIADFGLSNVFDDQRLLSTFCGSPLYASPEIVKGTPYHGPEVDCWSLGVLLYTLVYGAMPFDGSNFKRLVKQISQGDYFEPVNRSPASPLIHDMLTVNPKNRANIEKICSHWWVNETYDIDCLEISEELANQTPVRLDLLLSLAPPPPQLESDKLLVTGDVSDDVKTECGQPARSQSVGSLMELSHPAERRIKELIKDDDKISPKRKLETTISTDNANLDRNLKRKDKIIKENTVADITVCNNNKSSVSRSVESTPLEDANMMTENEAQPLIKSLTQTISREVDMEDNNNILGAACVEILEEAKKKPSKIKKTLSVSGGTPLEGINEIPSQENVAVANKENELAEDKKPKKKIIKKKILTDKNENKSKTPSPQAEVNKTDEKSSKDDNINNNNNNNKPIERRRSRIFEAAEKFQNLITSDNTKPTNLEKPKKIIIPGVSVDGFKREFERKASLTSTSPPKLKPTPVLKKIDVEKKDDPTFVIPQPPASAPVLSSPTEPSLNEEAERKEKVKNAVNIISNALDKEGARKSKSRPCCVRKPPVPFGVSGRSASGNISYLTSPTSTLGPKPFVRPQFDDVKRIDNKICDNENKTSSAEITLKSATLPRRKTTKAEIQLNYPVPKPATMEFKTEMAHQIEAPSTPKITTQRSEVVMPVNNHLPAFRSSSLDSDNKPKERIIPIAFEKVDKPPLAPQKLSNSVIQKTNSISRQSTQESDSETTSLSGEPIRKSPREYIIPIAVEGGGYVTPRAGSLEPSESNKGSSRSKFGRGRRMNSLFSDRDSEDESPFSNLHRHSSFNKDDSEGKEDSRFHHLHRLRSSRPKKSTIEHTDSVSSGEDDLDDDGFEILTAENLFSTLLSRVRDLTQRLNVEDGGRPGFPTSRLLSHFDHGTNFWNLHNRLDPLTRHSSINRGFSRHPSSENSSRNFSTSSSTTTPWRRNVSRDLASDIENVFNDRSSSPITTTSSTTTKTTTTATTANQTSHQRPRGDNNKKSKKERNLNLADIDLNKLPISDEDALALSYLTPGLSRRIQKHLLAQLAPNEIKKLHRTLSSCAPKDSPYDTNPNRINYSSRHPSVDRFILSKNDSIPEVEPNQQQKQEQLKTQNDTVTDFYRKSYGTKSLREPRIYSVKSPDSSLSESLSKSDSLKILEQDIDNNNKTEIRKPTTVRRISRFLRPDFFDTPKDESLILKEKKEREMETQKVLKEIRDKRKSKSRRSASRDRKETDINTNKLSIKNNNNQNDNNYIDKNGNNKETKIHEYVNVPGDNSNINKSNKNKDNKLHDYVNVKGEEPPKKERISKLIRPKSYPTNNSDNNNKTSSPDKESTTKIIKLKKTFIRQKDNNSEKEAKNESNETEKSHKNKLLQSIEKKLEKFRNNKDDEIKITKKSGVENTIKRLREQSLPRSLEQCTESALLKRAVSVEDLTKFTSNKPLQASRKSVTKILGLFKKYEEQDNSDKNLRKKKNKNCDNNKQTSLNEDENGNNNNENDNSAVINNKETKLERPRSLLFDRMKTFQNGAKNDQKKVSKLPSFTRRSLNLDNVESVKKPDRSNLKLDLKSPVKDIKIITTPADSGSNVDDISNNRLSLATTTTDESSAFLSPYDENMSDSWSICSDCHTNDPLSPTSPNGFQCSGDESESVSDRIRRKSFYTRFNENKKPRKLSLTRNYDLYGSLDRSSTYDFPRRYGFYQEPRYSRNSSVNLNDYVNYPKRYNSQKLGRSTIFSDSDDNALDDLLTTARSKKYSSQLPSSRLLRTSAVSPVNEYFTSRPTSSLISNIPSSSEPI